nr:ECF-type sigma factor [uncultured Brevundimonas sp.]
MHDAADRLAGTGDDLSSLLAEASSTPEETRVLLRRWQNGALDARDELIKRLHPELVEIAAARLRRERDTSLSTGDLINQVVLRIIRAEGLALTDRAHFVALSSRMMRHILVDHARAKSSSKRDHAKVELSTAIDGGQRVDLISLESALIRLKAIDAQLMELVEMRYFGGMTIADISVVLGVSEPTVKRRWQVARAWLADALESQVDHD